MRKTCICRGWRVEQRLRVYLDGVGQTRGYAQVEPLHQPVESAEKMIEYMTEDCEKRCARGLQQ